MFSVKPLRLASFRAILEDLADAASDPARPPPRPDSATNAPSDRVAHTGQFGSVLNAMVRGSWNFVSPARLSNLYAEARAGATVETSGLSETESIAEELCIRPRLSAKDLRRIRREFALGNHPDRVSAPRRERATRRMIIANALIEQALKVLPG